MCTATRTSSYSTVGPSVFFLILSLSLCARDHHENWKFAYNHTLKNSLIPKMLFFLIYDEKYRSYRGKTVSKQWRHQALVNAWPSWIDARRQCILLVIITFAYRLSKRLGCWQVLHGIVLSIPRKRLVRLVCIDIGATGYHQQSA